MSRRPRVALMLELEWPFKRHTDIFAGTQRYAQEHGWESIIDEFAAENLPARGTTQGVPYDGIIGRATPKLAERAARLNVPVVNVWLSSPVWKHLPSVFPDYAVCGRLRAEHLLARGLRRFAALAREDRAQKIELAAFCASVAEAGFPCATIKLPLNPTRTYATWQKSEQRIEAWMSAWQPPIGVFVSGDEVGRLVAQMCGRRGWRVPQDVAIITGWNEETICLHPQPSLSSVEIGYERIGYQAAKLLGELMNAKNAGASARRTAPPQHLLIPPQAVIVRESTDFHAVDDPVVAPALAFIAANSHRDIAADDVSRAVGIESRTLQRRFRTVLDRPIATEIRRVRIERAKRELTQTKRSMAEIARDVGFGEAMRMYEVFRRELGVTPTEYRKQRQTDREV